MQTITKNSSSCYLYEDDEVIIIGEDFTVVGEPPILIIGDINSQNGEVYEDVTPPVDWVGNKYLFDGTNWTPNPDFPQEEVV